jgi:hypothetical protein
VTKFDYTVELFAGPKHPKARPGDRILEVGVSGSALGAELAATRARIKRGEVSRAKVTNHVAPFGSYEIYD